MGYRPKINEMMIMMMMMMMMMMIMMMMMMMMMMMIEKNAALRCGIKHNRTKCQPKLAAERNYLHQTYVLVAAKTSWAKSRMVNHFQLMLSSSLKIKYKEMRWKEWDGRNIRRYLQEDRCIGFSIQVNTNMLYAWGMRWEDIRHCLLENRYIGIFLQVNTNMLYAFTQPRRFLLLGVRYAHTCEARHYDSLLGFLSVKDLCER